MILKELAQYIEQNGGLPSELDENELSISDWIFIYDSRDEYLIFAVVNDNVIEYMERFPETFNTMLSNVISIGDMEKRLDFDKIGQQGYGTMDSDDKEFIQKLGSSTHTVLDFNSNDCYELLHAITRMNIQPSPNKIEIEG